jgi:5-methylcytosine-specific restriction endonuclease McrA
MPRFQFINEKYSQLQQSPYQRYIKRGAVEENNVVTEDNNTKTVPETHGSYGALILHPNWKLKRKEILKRDQFKCVICGSENELQVHHRQYHFVEATKKFKVPWDYPDHLLITLCSPCHARGHSKYKVPSINV